MKYVKKMPNTDIELSKQLLDDGWIKIKEPRSLIVAIIYSFPFAIFLGGIMVLMMLLFKPNFFDFLFVEPLVINITFDLQFLLFFIVLLFYMFIHEMIHAIFIPNFIHSDKTFWGINGIFGFVFTTEPIKKNRYLLISVMPFITLSLLAMLVFYLLGILNWFTFLLCLFNATGSCVDFLNIFNIMFNVKSKRMIISNGFETFYSSEK